jgi:hypothetical protein
MQDTDASSASGVGRVHRAKPDGRDGVSGVGYTRALRT